MRVDSKLLQTPFMQQTMLHCVPKHHPLIFVLIFAALGLFFVPIGAFLMSASGTMLQVAMTHTNGLSDNVSYTVDAKELQRRKRGLSVYYEFQGFYQNVRSYVNGFNQLQLKSDAPFIDAGLDAHCSSVGPHSPNAVDHPCGVIYKSYPANESYSIALEARNGAESIGSVPLHFDTSIAKKTDRKGTALFGKQFKKFPDWERKSAWMRPGAFGNSLKKAYGAISWKQLSEALQYLRGLNQNAVIWINIKADGYYEYASKRNVVVQQNSAFGGKTETRSIGKISLAAGVILLAMAFLFMIVWLIQRTQDSKAAAKLISYEKHRRDPTLNDGVAPIPMISASESSRKERGQQVGKRSVETGTQIQDAISPILGVSALVGQKTTTEDEKPLEEQAAPPEAECAPPQDDAGSRGV